MDGEPWSPLLQWFIAGRGSLEGSRHTAQLHHPKPLQAQNLTLHSLGGLQYKHINSTMEFVQAMVWRGRSKKTKPKNPPPLLTLYYARGAAQTQGWTLEQRHTLCSQCPDCSNQVTSSNIQPRFWWFSPQKCQYLMNNIGFSPKPLNLSPRTQETETVSYSATYREKNPAI